MVLTTEIVGATFTAAIVVGGLIWKAATKLSSIESKVDTALAWITEQKQATKPVALPARKRSRR